MLCKQCFSALQRKELSAPIYWLSAGNLLVLCIYSAFTQGSIWTEAPGLLTWMDHVH